MTAILQKLLMLANQRVRMAKSFLRYSDFFTRKSLTAKAFTACDEVLRHQNPEGENRGVAGAIFYPLI